MSLSIRKLAEEVGLSKTSVEWHRNQGLTDDDIRNMIKDKSNNEMSLQELKALKIKQEIENKKLANRKLEITNAKILGELIEKVQVSEMMVKIATAIKLSQSQMMQSLPMSLLGKSVDDICHTLKTEFENQNNFIAETLKTEMEKLTQTTENE